MLAKVEDVLKITNTTLLYTFFSEGLGTAYNLPKTLTEENIRAALEGFRAKAIEGRQYKGVRPWELVDVASALDPTQAWIGLEYENGFDSREDYRRIVEWTVDNTMYSAMDREGPGAYKVEMTFAPVNLNEFIENDTISRVIRQQQEFGIRQAEFDDNDEQWGIHVNISTPTQRFLTETQMRMLNMSLQCSFSAMSPAAKRRLFGRIPYGYSYVRSAGDRRWFEFKLFNTTDDLEDYEEYKLVIRNLAKAVEYLASNVDELMTQEAWQLHHTNRYDYYNPPVVKYLTNFGRILSGAITTEDYTLGRGNTRRMNLAFESDY